MQPSKSFTSFIIDKLVAAGIEVFYTESPRDVKKKSQVKVSLMDFYQMVDNGDWFPILALEVYSYTKVGKIAEREIDLETFSDQVIREVCKWGVITEIQPMKEYKEYIGLAIVLADVGRKD